MSRLPILIPRLCLLIACAGLALAPLPASPRETEPEKQERTFEIPAGEAVSTLSLFARQSSLPLVYLVADVRGEKTRAINGSYESMKALENMLQGSNLSVSYDPEAKALMVTRQKENPRSPPKEPK